MTGPLSDDFADVRRGLHTLTDASFGEADDAAMHEDSLNTYAALARIEEHTHNTEELLADLLDEIDRMPSHTYSWTSPLWKEWATGRLSRMRNRHARAALSAGEGTPA